MRRRKKERGGGVRLTGVYVVDVLAEYVGTFAEALDEEV